MMPQKRETRLVELLSDPKPKPKPRWRGRITPTVDAWVVCTYYEPFRLGGPWVHKRFKVSAAVVPLCDGLEGVAFVDKKYSRQWMLHERTTGALLGQDLDIRVLVPRIILLIQAQEDFRQQMAQFGDPMRFEVATADEAFRRLYRGRQRSDSDNDTDAVSGEAAERG